MLLSLPFPAVESKSKTIWIPGSATVPYHSMEADVGNEPDMAKYSATLSVDVVPCVTTRSPSRRNS